MDVLTRPMGLPANATYDAPWGCWRTPDGAAWTDSGFAVALDGPPTSHLNQLALGLVAKLDAQQNDPKREHYWSQTYTGRRFYYEEDMIPSNPYVLEDIAHQTSTISRYGGAAKYPYWVSQHQVALAEMIWRDTQDPFLVMDALFHDGEEGYTGDLRTMIKDKCPEFRKITKPINAAMRVSLRAQGIPVPLHESDIVRAYDRRIVADEKAVVMNPSETTWYGMDGFEPLGAHPDAFAEISWRTAKKRWLDMVETFTKICRNRQ